MIIKMLESSWPELLQDRELKEIYSSYFEEDYKISKYDIIVNTKSKEILILYIMV